MFDLKITFLIIYLIGSTCFTQAVGQIITIFANRNLGQSVLRQGFLHGISYEKGQDYSVTVRLTKALKPKAWRLSNYNQVYDFVVNEAKLPQSQATEIVYNIQDTFNFRYGQNIQISSTCPKRKKNCFQTYDSFRMAWKEVVKKIIQTADEKKMILDFFEVFAEPTTGHTKLAGISEEQLADIFKLTHDIVREYRPNAKIVAPSLVAYEIKGLKKFLSYVVANKLRLDAISWHEFGRPDILPTHVSELQEFLKTQPKLCEPSCPEFHIGEYGPPRFHFVPGLSVGWLYYLEKASVHQANRACWDVDSNGKKWSSCWAGINDMFLEDNKTPQPLYWVYKAYADLSNVRLSCETSNPMTIALASKDDEKKELSILTGNYMPNGAEQTITIVVKDYPYAKQLVSVEIHRIPNPGNVVQALPTLAVPEKKTLSIKDGVLSLSIEKFKSGDAYNIIVQPKN